MSKTRKIIFYLIMITVVFFVAIVSLELFYRCFLLYQSKSGITPVGKRHPDYHHDLKENFSGSQVFGNNRVMYRTNSLGFRDKTVRNVSAVKEKRRIVFVGDSFTEGVGVEYEKSFVGIIEDSLPNVEILNAGVKSHAPVLENVKIKKKILALNPDQIVMLIDISDVQDTLYYNDLSLPEGGFYGKDTSPLAIKIIRNSKFMSAVLNRYFPDVLNRMYYRNGTLWKNYYKERHRWLIDSDVYSRWGRQGLEQLKADLLETVAICNKNGIALSFVIYQWPETIGQKEVVDFRGMVRDISSRQGVQFIDLFDLFSPVDIPACFFEGDSHWSVEGHRRVANQLLLHIR